MARPILERWLLDLLPEGSRAWLEVAFTDVRAAGPFGAEFARAWSAAGRRLGRVPVAPGDDDRRTLTEHRAPFVPAGWGADELGRALLLLAAVEGRALELLPPFVEELYRKGELREQQALLRVLAYLPQPGSYAGIAVEAVRSNITAVLEVLACDNPFPAAHLERLAFNQMVMKAVSNGLPLARIIGLQERSDSELKRMLRAFARERQSAGRAVPDDVELVVRLEEQGVSEPSGDRRS